MTDPTSYKEMAKTIAKITALHGGAGALVGGGIGAAISPEDRWDGARQGALAGGVAGAGFGLGHGLGAQLTLRNGHAALRKAEAEFLRHESVYEAATDAVNNARKVHLRNLPTSETAAAVDSTAEFQRMALDRLSDARAARDIAASNYRGDQTYAQNLPGALLGNSAVLSMLAGGLAGHSLNKRRSGIAQLPANQPDDDRQKSADTLMLPPGTNKLTNNSTHNKLGAHITKHAKDTANGEKPSNKWLGVTALGSGILGTAGATVGNRYALDKTRSNGALERQIAGHDALYQSVRSKSPVPVHTSLNEFGYFMPTRDPHIVISDGAAASVLGHEIGHANIHGGNLTGKAQLAAIASNRLVDLAGGLPGFGLGAFTDSGWGGAALSAGIPLAATVPLLAAEAVASRKGMQHLRDSGASPAAIAAAAKTLRSAYGSYLTNSASQAFGGLASFGFGRLARRGVQYLNGVNHEPVKQAYLVATGDSTFDEEKMAGWLTDTISKAKSYVAPGAIGKVVSPASAALKANGTMKQMQAGRNFGGAEVDPFAKMRKSMMAPAAA